MTTNERRIVTEPVPPWANLTEEYTATWFVIGVWFTLTVMALGFVTMYGNRTPRWEDWFLVPPMTGAQRVNPAWLWENVQGHRIPIFKIVLLTCYSIYGFNSKPILYLNVLLFSALSLGLLWTIRKVRGHSCQADAFLPIILLNLGQTEAFSWAQTFLYVAATCLETLVLILIVASQRALNRTTLALAGASLVLLPLTFGGGLVFAALMVPWLLYQGWIVPRTRKLDRRHTGAISLISAIMTVIIIGLYFLNYQTLNTAPAERYIEPGFSVYALTALKYVASGFGAAAAVPWWKLPAFLVSVILSTITFCLIAAIVHCRFTGDPRAIGLISYIVSSLGVAWVVGVSRYGWGDAILDSRYSAMSVTVLIGSYFVWELHGARFLIPLGRMFMFVAAACFLHANLQLGIKQAVMRRDAERAFLRDLQASQPIPRLVAHHAWVTYYYHDRLAGYLRQLRDAGIVPYDRLPSDLSFQVRTLGPEPASIHEIKWDGGGGKVIGPNAYVRFNLGKPEFISGLRFRFSLVDPGGVMPNMKVRWYSESRAEFQQYNCHYESKTGEPAEIIVYIDDMISSVMILPNNRVSTFRISGIELLLPLDQ